LQTLLSNPFLEAFHVQGREEELLVYPRDIQKLSGHGLGQLAVVALFEQVVGQDDLRRSLPTSTIL